MARGTTTRGTTARALRILVLLPLLFVMSSCYVPDKFRAELRLSKYGDYLLTYEGDLVYLPILHDYAENKVKPEDDARRQEEIRQDLIRDRAFSQVTTLGHGRFHVSYARGARLGRDQLVAIIRRDARMLALKSKPDNRIIIAANEVKPSDADALLQSGIGMKGEFRITTDANVIENNATEVRPFGTANVYIWKIDGPLSPMPRMVIVRDIDPQRPLP
ncbi:MAG: hypothetical protein M0006_02110 [Magnetospirillum sp.]|nr:hypothetical protein [Magnetospirillum sp.]